MKNKWTSKLKAGDLVGAMFSDGTGICPAKVVEIKDKQIQVQFLNADGYLYYKPAFRLSGKGLPAGDKLGQWGDCILTPWNKEAALSSAHNAAINFIRSVDLENLSREESIEIYMAYTKCGFSSDEVKDAIKRLKKVSK